MGVRMDFRIITKNSAADPEIKLYVLVRAFLEEEKSVASGARTHAVRSLGLKKSGFENEFFWCEGIFLHDF